MVAAPSSTNRKTEFVAPRCVDHPSFHEKNAASLYCVRADAWEKESASTSHLPDEATRELAKGMHYAAYRLRAARDAAKAQTWSERYVALRNLIVLGNRKLIYRAVHTRVRDPQLAEDFAAECHVVMIRAVASYNPWLGIRFSTYAFTCLLRELTRLVHKQAKDRLRHAASFDEFALDTMIETAAPEVSAETLDSDVLRFFGAEHPLLSDREKQVLRQRFGLDAAGAKVKLKEIGKDLAISKERVRQLQNSGMEKLRCVLAADGVDV